MKKRRKTRYYHSYTDDFVETKDQQYKVPGTYRWIRDDPVSRLLSFLIYTAALVFSNIYCRLFLHVKIKNSRILRQAVKTGAFLYGNHTQPVGDVFNPALACFPGRIYTLASPANLGIPVLGKILPYLGALPVPDDLHSMKKLNEAIELRLKQKCFIVVYPEAHVWEYYTEIRPFSETSFKFPVKYDKPVYCMTTTYQRRRFGKKPSAVIFIDGPFYRDETAKPKAQAAKLRDTVYCCMKERSKNSTYKYIRYEKYEEAKD